MKATLYQFVTSPFCSKVRKILDYKGLDYQIVEVDYVERKELIAASGQIMVPALRLENVQEDVRNDAEARAGAWRRSSTRTVSRCAWRSVSRADDSAGA